MREFQKHRQLKGQIQQNCVYTVISTRIASSGPLVPIAISLLDVINIFESREKISLNVPPLHLLFLVTLRWTRQPKQ